MPPTSRTFNATLLPAGDTTMAAIEIPFDPKEVFGKVRAPVVVTIGAYSYRSTICRMEGQTFVPLRRSHREAAGLTQRDTVRVTLTSDDAPRTIDPPMDLKKALKAAGLLEAFEALSFTHQREHVEAIENAKKEETRLRRIESCLSMLSAAPRPAARAKKAPASRSKPAKKTPRRR